MKTTNAKKTEENKNKKKEKLESDLDSFLARIHRPSKLYTRNKEWKKKQDEWIKIHVAPQSTQNKPTNEKFSVCVGVNVSVFVLFIGWTKRLLEMWCVQRKGHKRKRV